MTVYLGPCIRLHALPLNEVQGDPYCPSPTPVNEDVYKLSEDLEYHDSL
jgi:hypothetical protein